jgi:3-phenylpropionate/trans-cinnamate dioxygenase ferredoxin component
MKKEILEMQYLKVANVNDVPPGTMFAAKLGKEAILIANIENEFYAIQRKCPHFGADLCAGKLDVNIVTCPKHGAKFDVTNGVSTGKAGIAFLKFNVKNCKTYTVKREGKDLLVLAD